MREYFENQEEVIKRVKNEPRVHFVKVDKNGTTVFVDNSCSRCGGSGVIPYYGHIDNGTCFKCGGNGLGGSEEIKIYTDEYGAKLKSQRAAREEAKRQKLIEESVDWNKEWMEREGFNENGITYLILGDTYAMKEELKQNGAKFNYLLGWHVADAKEYDAAPVTIEQVTHTTWNGRLCYIDNDEEATEMINKLKDDAEKAIKAARGEHIGEYIGTVGERREFVCKLVGHFTYDTYYTYSGEVNHIYKFEDENGDIVVWKTSSYLDDEKTEYRFTATVKEHSEYKGEKQTVVNRPKFH